MIDLKVVQEKEVLSFRGELKSAVGSPTKKPAEKNGKKWSIQNLLRMHKNGHLNTKITPFRFRSSLSSCSSALLLLSSSNSCFPSQGFLFICLKLNLHAFPALCWCLRLFELWQASSCFPKIYFPFSVWSLIFFSSLGWFEHNCSCCTVLVRFFFVQTKKFYLLRVLYYEFFYMLLSMQVFLDYVLLWNAYGIWVGKNGIFCNHFWRTSYRVQDRQVPSKNNIFLFSFQQ